MMRQLFSPLHHGFIHCTSDRIEPGGRTPNIEPEEWTVRHIAGVAEQDLSYEECELGQLQNSPLKDSRDAMGEWIAVAASSAANSSYLLFSDVHGYGTLFYSFIPGQGVVFAETYQGVLGALESRGADRTVNWTNYVAALTARDQHFEGAFSTHSMASEVRLLSREQALLVTADQIQLVARSALGGSLAEDDFSTALDAGITYVTGLLTRLSEQGMLNTLHLSGGVDSRLCLALAAAAGVTDRFQIRTADPRTWRHPSTLDGIVKDVEIANEIRTRFGMRWAPTYPHTKISVSFDESVALKQTYRSSFLYSLAGSNSHGMALQRIAAIRGGGGELLRATHGSQRLDRDYADARASNPDLEPDAWRARRVSRASLAIPELIRYVRTAARNSYRGIPSDSPLIGFERHYLNYRNRSHFGHARTSLMGNELAVHILSNPWLLRAAQLTPVSSRIEGHVVSEIFRRTAPQLLDLPFESDIWTARLTHGATSIPASSWETSIDAIARTEDDQFLPGHEHGDRNTSWDFSSKSATANMIANNFHLLEESAPQELRDVLIEQHVKLSGELEARRFPASKVLAATSAAAEAVSPKRVSVLMVELGDSEGTHTPWVANAARVGAPSSIWISQLP
ncbi:hypothetical protein [Brachybacterium tyrofermentans]|uniref:hypothetical protein n=2 Tax=Brachybacterium tyrofermentans TaxID=47848 RepID=UPI003FD5D075